MAFDHDARVQRLTVVHQRLTAAVAALAGGEQWQRMLAVATRFHSYSPSNVLLIAAQAPHATRVAGYRTWASLGRQVRKGEKGIAILAPCVRRITDPEAVARVSTEAAAAPPGDPAGRELARRLLGFRVVYVFDVSQTDGDPLPDVEPRLLTGDAPAALWERLATVLHADGFSIERGNCRGANGYTDFARRVVRVRDDVEQAQAVKTLAHEVGHVAADHEHRFLDPRGAVACRGVAEVEAESIAFLLCARAGLDTSGYSLAYLAGWSGADPVVLRDTAARVITTAARLVDAIDPVHGDAQVPADARRSVAAPAVAGMSGSTVRGLVGGPIPTTGGPRLRG